MVVQRVGFYTHIFASPGSRLTGNKAGTYMSAGPDWTGEFFDPEERSNQA